MLPPRAPDGWRLSPTARVSSNSIPPARQAGTVALRPPGCARRSRARPERPPRGRPRAPPPRRPSTPRPAAARQPRRRGAAGPARAGDRRSSRSRRRGRRARRRPPRRTGARCSAMRRPTSATTSRAALVALARGVEHRARPRRAPAGSSLRAALRPRPRARQSGERTGRRPRRARRGRSRSPRRIRAARVWSSPRSTIPAPMPVPTDRKTKSSTPRATPSQRSPRAARLMSFSSMIGRPRRASSSASKGRPSSPGTFAASWSVPSAAPVTPGTPTTTPSIRSPGRPAAGDERVGSSAHGRECPLRVGALELDVLTRADRPAEVADRTAQEPCPEVEPEDERSLREPVRSRRRRSSARSEPRRSRARARPRPASRSASETVGFEIPARREISARETGARSRTSSSTVCSLRRLRSGGAADVREVVSAISSRSLTKSRRRVRVDSHRRVRSLSTL